MRLNFMFVLYLLLPFFIAACSHVPPHPASKNSDSVQLASNKTIILTMGSGLMGKMFEMMPSSDRHKALEAEYRALEHGRVEQTVAWQGEGNVNSGTVTAGRFYKVGSQNCRQYSHDFNIARTSQHVSASACRNDDGSWSPLL